MVHHERGHGAGWILTCFIKRHPQKHRAHATCRNLPQLDTDKPPPLRNLTQLDTDKPPTLRLIRTKTKIAYNKRPQCIPQCHPIISHSTWRSCAPLAPATKALSDTADSQLPLRPEQERPTRPRVARPLHYRIRAVGGTSRARRSSVRRFLPTFLPSLPPPSELHFLVLFRDHQTDRQTRP
jgi:hypothetical protein